jgi:hypothetical protein
LKGKPCQLGSEGLQLEKFGVQNSEDMNYSSWMVFV